MKILIAPDKFKGCLAATQVADAMAAGVRRADPDASIDLCPIADGGEGFVDTLVRATHGQFLTQTVTGPLPEMKVNAVFGILGDGNAPTNDLAAMTDPRGKTAVIEMSAAAGLALLRPEQRDPMATTTFGVGQLLTAAAQLGCKQILLGIGGSATTDGGIGCAQATGHTIVLRDGEPVSPTEPLTGRDLERVVLVKRHRGETTDGVHITVACDVTNPLYGPTGAANVFGPQKGATPQQVKQLDEWLKNLATRMGRETEATTPGAGAAGGLGFGLLAYFGATLAPGIDLVLNAVKLRDRLTDVDLCLTGEGGLDGQSADGKAVVGVSRLCREASVPCIALAGSIGADAERVYGEGVSAYFSIVDRPMPLETAIKNASALITSATENAVRCHLAPREYTRGRRSN